MRTGRETANLRIFESKKAYIAHLRKFFDVGENAFILLNRAAGLKQLNSIDEIFRELVLDDRSAFDRVLEVAGEFDNLAAIHAELEAAQRQQESLVPVAGEHQKLLEFPQEVRTLPNFETDCSRLVRHHRPREVVGSDGAIIHKSRCARIGIGRRA